MKHKLFHASGFTIVELLVVVIVIGILATIVVISGNAYIKDSADTTVQSNLQSAITKFRNDKAKLGSYPTTQAALNGLVKPNSNVVLTLVASNGSDFCINAQSTKYENISYFMSQLSTKPSTTDCTPDVAATGGGGDDGGDDGSGDDGGGDGGGGGEPQYATSATPSTYDYGTFSAANGRTGNVSFTLTNNSSNPVVVLVNGYGPPGSGSESLYYSFTSTCQQVTLQPGGSCTLNQNFGNYINNYNSPPDPTYGVKHGYLAAWEKDPGDTNYSNWHVVVSSVGNLTP